MSNPLRIVEGNVSPREVSSPGYYSYDSEAQGDIGPGTDILFDFGKMRKDVAIQVTSPAFVKFDLTTNPPIKITVGIFTFTEQYASKLYLTTTVLTGVTILANG